MPILPLTNKNQRQRTCPSQFNMKLKITKTPPPTEHWVHLKQDHFDYTLPPHNQLQYFMFSDLTS